MGQNIVWHDFKVDKAAREAAFGHKPFLIWFTGLSGSGKSTIANIVESLLFKKEIHTYLLDGDNIRHGLCRDLGFTSEDRSENIRRIGEVSKLFVDAGVATLACFISPLKEQRELVRNLFSDGEFIEVFVKCDVENCIQRDPKGLYKKALAGEIKNFTGLDSPFEIPSNPFIRIETVNQSLEESSKQLIEAIIPEITL